MVRQRAQNDPKNSRNDNRHRKRAPSTLAAASSFKASLSKQISSAVTQTIRRSLQLDPEAVSGPCARCPPPRPLIERISPRDDPPPRYPGDALLSRITKDTKRPTAPVSPPWSRGPRAERNPFVADHWVPSPGRYDHHYRQSPPRRVRFDPPSLSLPGPPIFPLLASTLLAVLTSFESLVLDSISTKHTVQSTRTQSPPSFRKWTTSTGRP